MPWMKWRMTLDSLCGRTRRLHCFFWIILLFAAGSLFLFIQKLDQSEMVPRQGADMKLGETVQQAREDKEHGKSKGYQEHHVPDVIVPSPISPMQFPKFWKSQQLVSGLFPLHRWRKFSSIMEQRRQLTKNMCAKYKSNISKTITWHHMNSFYVEDKHKLLYCEVPKAGCSNWKRTLMVLAGKAWDPRNISHDTVHYHNHLKTLNSFDQQGIMQRLGSYTKVMFVREPLERAVSAYRDKFENPNKYYHNLFGKPIISKYRPNASRSALESGNGVTFQEFVHYLLDVHRPVGMDIHWEAANQLCNPCHIDYDFIGKFENMAEESNLLLRLVRAPHNLTLPNFKDRNSADKKTTLQITQKYFAQLGKLERQRMYDFYYMDYLMFNYSKPFQDLY
ncbi:carbohydrate sulfotransferase 8-like isoform X2 [Phyllopteryx taeniolatus]|uniref:carbohydrate sulfotransferase 8-like isoform X2 n=1 Tax=Phyllopteryx taeniolatus TaxID=161469 RepID=UPI002AD4DD36|nr:carbohydrate sulfotransferase 8-like isoform X2 [Phyllopteryx taeniolatus]